MAHTPEIQQLLDAGVHFGHLTRKWNPNMAPYIFMERNGIHIIDLQKTQKKLATAADAMGKIAGSGRKILFVATKKQAKEIVADTAKALNMPYIVERWPGGMLTNFVTIRKAIKKMSNIDKMKTDGTLRRHIAIIMPGRDLSQPARPTTIRPASARERTDPAVGKREENRARIVFLGPGRRSTASRWPTPTTLARGSGNGRGGI